MARFTTVRVYQDAIEALADDPNDPIADILDSIAEDIREHALQNIENILGRIPSGFDLQIESGKDSKGLFFRIVPDGGRLSNYLIFKEFREHSWFAPAVEAVVGDVSVRNAGNRSARAFRSNMALFPRGASF